jgi:hypothetical protein
MATITAAAGGGNWNAGGSWVGGVSPVAGDDVILDATSGNITLTATASCQSINCTGYTGTFAMGSQTLNVANSLTFVSGMTLTSTASVATINFNGTTTGHTVTTGGKTMPKLQFAGAGGGWTLASNLVMSSGTNDGLFITAGTFNDGGYTVRVPALYTSGSTTKALTKTGQWTVGWVGNATVSITGSNFTLSDSGGWIIDGSTNTTAVGWLGGGLSYSDVTSSGTFQIPSVVIDNVNTFSNLTLTFTTGTNRFIQLSANQTITGTLTISGSNPINRVSVQPGANLTSISTNTRTLSAGTVSLSNVCLVGIIGSGAASWDFSASTTVGNGGNTTNITFPAPVNCYLKTGASCNTSDAVWFTTSGGSTPARVPLPGDTAIIDANSITAGSVTITQNLHLFSGIDFTGVTNNPTISVGTNRYFIGDVVFSSGMSINNEIRILARNGDVFDLSPNGKSLSNVFLITGYQGGRFDLRSNYTNSSRITIEAPSFYTNDYNLSTSDFSTSGGLTRTLSFGSSTITLTGTGSLWSFVTGGLTFLVGTSTILINNGSGTAKTWAGGGLTYYNLTVASNNTTITGSNTFSGTLAVNTAGMATGLRLTAGTTQTLNASNLCLTSNGSSGNLAKLTASATATLSAPNQFRISEDYLSLTNIAATQTSKFYAGANSTDGGGNTNWIFSAAPFTSGYQWTF